MPEALRGKVFLFEHWQWLFLLALLVVSFLGARLLLFVLRQVVARRLARQSAHFELKQLQRAGTPLGFAAGAAVFALGVRSLELAQPADSTLLRGLGLIVIVSLIWWAYRVIDFVATVLASRAQSTATRLDELLVPLLRRSAQVIVVIFGVIFLADNLGANISSLIAGVGLGGIAIALAAQDVVKNLFGSLTVLIDRPFNVGDWVTVGSIQGSVENVGLRSTRIRTVDDSLVTLPNANLISASVDNFGERGKRRWRLNLGITYETERSLITRLCERLTDELQRDELIIDDSVQVGIFNLGESAIEVRVSVYFATVSFADELAGRHRLILRILELCESLGIELAYPTRRIVESGPGEP